MCLCNSLNISETSSFVNSEISIHQPLLEHKYQAGGIQVQP